MFNPALFQRLSALVLGEPDTETPAEAQARMIYHAKTELLAKSQRSVILEDLEHSIRTLYQYIESKDTNTSRLPLRVSGYEIESKGNEDDDDITALNNQRAIMMESTEDGMKLLLNDDIAVVNMVCSTLDRCVSHGLRQMETNEAENVKFFGIVKWTCTRVDAIRQKQMLTALAAASTNGTRQVCEVVTSSVEPDLPRSLRGFLAAARAAAGLTNVHTDEGKARAFIRQALNMHVLQASMSMILSETNLDLLTSYYTEYALFRQRDDVKVFLHLLKTLDELSSFAFVIDDMRLDISPEEMPFVKQLPKPKAQKIHRKAPKLIDPEDMVGGRVRLCKEDEDTNLLARKLVHHNELRSAFNSHKGGNPLSEILENAAQSQKIEDATVAVLRFLELGYPEYDVFGTELLDVLCNPFLSGMARFETALGIPDVVEACICYLYDHLDTPGLFQVHLDADHVMELRDSIEQVGGFHKNMAVDAHEVTAILYQYLWELPDSLLTEERMDNWLACGGNSTGMDCDEKKVLLKVLTNDLPWYSKPLLERLSRLITTALEPCHAEKSGLTIYSVANTLAPLLIRKKHTYRPQEYEDSNSRKYPVGYQHASSVRYRLLPDGELFPFESERERVAHESKALRHATRDAQESAHVISLLIREQNYVFSDFRDELTRRRARLQEKVFMLETIRFKMEESIDVGNPTHVRLLKRLWDVLVPDADENEVSILKNDGTTDVDAMLSSSRWRISGFHTENPLGGFRGGGVLALECMIFFLEEYPDKARSMMIRNALPGGNRYPFPVACINVMRMMMKLLMLDEAPDGCSKLVLHAADERTPTTVLKMRIAERVSRTPFWHVFDDDKAFYKMEAMAFMLLDLHWIHSGATQMGFQPVLDATRRQMGWLLEQAPQRVEDMWAKWIEVRERHASKFTPMYQNTTRMTTSKESDELVEVFQQRQNEARLPSYTGVSERTIKDVHTPVVSTTTESVTVNSEKVVCDLETLDMSSKAQVDPALAF